MPSVDHENGACYDSAEVGARPSGPLDLRPNGRPDLRGQEWQAVPEAVAFEWRDRPARGDDASDAGRGRRDLVVVGGQPNLFVGGRPYAPRIACDARIAAEADVGE